MSFQFHRRSVKPLSSFAVLFFVLCLFALAITSFSWIIPGGTFSLDTLKYHAVAPQKLTLVQTFDVFYIAIKQAAPIVLFIYFQVTIIEILIKEDSFAILLNKLYAKYAQTRFLFCLILIWLFGLGGTLFGLAEESIPFYPLVISFFISLRLRSKMVLLVLFVSSSAGIMFSTINPFSVGIANELASLPLHNGLARRFVFWLLAMTYVSFWCFYALKKEQPSLSRKEEHAPPIHHLKSIPLTLTVFTVGFAILIVGILPWRQLVPLPSLVESIPFLQKFAQWAPFGDWGFKEMALYSLILLLLIAGLSSLNFRAKGASLITGFKSTVGVSSFIILTRFIAQLLDKVYWQDAILYHAQIYLQNVAPHFYLLGLALLFVVLAFFITSTSALANLSLPLLLPLSQSVNIAPHTLINLYQGVQGFVNLLNPFFALLLAVLGFCRVSYKNWLQFFFPWGWGLLALVFVEVFWEFALP